LKGKRRRVARIIVHNGFRVDIVTSTEKLKGAQLGSCAPQEKRPPEKKLNAPERLKKKARSFTEKKENQKRKNARRKGNLQGPHPNRCTSKPETSSSNESGGEN